MTVTTERRKVFSPIVEKEEAGYCSEHQDNCHIKLELFILVFVGKSTGTKGRTDEEMS